MASPRFRPRVLSVRNSNENAVSSLCKEELRYRLALTICLIVVGACLALTSIVSESHHYSDYQRLYLLIALGSWVLSVYVALKYFGERSILESPLPQQDRQQRQSIQKICECAQELPLAKRFSSASLNFINATEIISGHISVFEFLTQSNPVGIAVIDLQGNFLRVNSAFLAMLGYSESQIDQITYFDITPVEFAPTEALQLESMHQTGKFGPFRKEFKKSDGTRVAVQLRGMMLGAGNEESSIWMIVEELSQHAAQNLGAI